MAPPEIISLGYAARQAFMAADSAFVWGNTSRGLFIATREGHIIFLTPETARGPLTINLNREDDRLKGVQVGTAVSLRKNQLSIPSTACYYPFTDLVVWAPPLPMIAAMGYPQIICRLNEISLALRRARPAHGLIGFLPFSDSEPTEGSSLWTFPGWSRFSFLTERQNPLATALSNHSALESVAILAELLGIGPGLTPSGDDFVLGAVLTINRWKNLDWIETDRKLFNRQIITAANEKTTLLSACLIQCAADGQADERLLDAIDYLFTGQGDVAQQVLNLLSWGASSGIDTLAGISVVVRAANS